MGTQTLGFLCLISVSDQSKIFLICLFHYSLMALISLCIFFLYEHSISFSPTYSHSKSVPSPSQVLSLLHSYLTDTHRPQPENKQDYDLSSAIFPRMWLATRWVLSGLYIGLYFHHADIYVHIYQQKQCAYKQFWFSFC